MSHPAHPIAHSAPTDRISRQLGMLDRILRAPHVALFALLLLELLIFSMLGRNFLSAANLFQVPRVNVELGLISLGMTAVIVTGGIDLSVGSLMGLSAVVFGKLWRDAGMPAPLAALVTLIIGAAAGGLNGALVTKLRIPALIVTLGSYSLFRGIAEGITGGFDNFTGFPAPFLFLGQGMIGPVSTQLPILLLSAVGFYLLVHRATFGRALSAIGYSPDGARYAGLRVERTVAIVYILSGICSSLAALIYVARVGQAKADAGAGYELLAVTAVVLGGTSIFGGAGSITGTLLGLASIALLQNGLMLADLPTELAGILTGALLLAAIAADWRGRADAARASPDSQTQEFSMRNSQLAALCAVILAAALLVVCGNWIMSRTLIDQLAARARSQTAQAITQPNIAPQSVNATAPNADNPPAPNSVRRLAIAMMPKNKGNAYFIACLNGAHEAAGELNVDLLWDGPTDTDPARQNEIVETWITRGVDAIAVSVENRAALSTSLRKAREKGIKVLTWDADADPDARDFFVNQATPEGIGDALMDDAAQVLGGKGDFAIITASLTAANQNDWIKYIKQRLADKYPDIKLADVEPCDDDSTKAFSQAQIIMNSHPDVKLLMAICTPGVPAAAEAVKQSGRTDVKVIGLGLPNDNKPYVHAGITPDVVLWNTMDLGYLTVRAADALVRGTLKPGDTAFTAGRLGQLQIRGDNILLGQPFSFTKDNIDRFDF